MNVAEMKAQGILEENPVLPQMMASARAEIPCGTWCYGVNPMTGERGKFRTFCGDWRNCNMCLQNKMFSIRKRLENFRDAGKFPVKVKLWCVSDEAWRKWSKNNGNKADYMRIPQGNGESFIILDPAIDVGIEIPISEALKWDWSVLLLNIPDTTRITGRLGIVEDHSEAVICVPRVSIDNEADFTPQEIQQINSDAWTSAVEKTADADPHTADELEAEVMRRTLVYRNELYMRGVQTTWLTGYKKIRAISDVNWKIGYMALIFRNKSSGWQEAEQFLRSVAVKT